MKRATHHIAAHDWQADDATDSVTLDFDARHRRRIVLHTDGGEDVLLDLERAVAMAHGDGLALEGGGHLVVKAAAEALVCVKASGADHLLRLAWHIGNRHLPAEITADAIYIRPDKVIENHDLKRFERGIQIDERGAGPDPKLHG